MKIAHSKSAYEHTMESAHNGMTGAHKLNQMIRAYKEKI